MGSLQALIELEAIWLGNVLGGGYCHKARYIYLYQWCSLKGIIMPSWALGNEGICEHCPVVEKDVFLIQCSSDCNGGTLGVILNCDLLDVFAFNSFHFKLDDDWKKLNYIVGWWCFFLELRTQAINKRDDLLENW